MTTGTSPPATPPPASASRLGAPLPPTRFGTTPRSRLPRGDVASFPGTTSTRPLAGRPTRATVAGDGPFTGRERRPLHRRPRPIRRWHLARRRVVAFVRVVGGRPVGFRPRSRTSPVPAPGTRLDRTRTLRAPVRVTHPHAVPARHGGRARRLPARRARRDARRRARPSGHFYAADRDEDYATPRLDDDGDGTGDDALGVASKTHDQLPTPLRDPNRREGDQNRRGPRRRSRARAGAAAFGGAAPGGSRARASRADPDADARGGDDSPGDARSVSPRDAERRRRFSPTRTREAPAPSREEAFPRRTLPLRLTLARSRRPTRRRARQRRRVWKTSNRAVV